MELKIGSGFAAFGKMVDRFLPSGYTDGMSLERQLALARTVPGLDAIALDYPAQFEDPVAMKQTLDDMGLTICTLEMGLYLDRKWKMGAFTAPDEATRRDAIDLVKRGLDAAAILGCPDILFWLGQDGYDYPFQVDYADAWTYLLEGIREVALHRPDIRISIEPKAKEPRVRNHIATSGLALLIAQTLGLPNVGVTLDLGHALVAGETPAESIALLSRFNRLFQLHVTDNWSDWDSDLLVGNVNLWSALESFYWLQRVGYDGWCLMDFFPYREDGFTALAQCIENTRHLARLAARLDETELRDLQKRHDAVAIGRLLWKEIVRD